jgi:hypothetical protein
LDRRRLLLTSAFGAGFIGPVGHFWCVSTTSCQPWLQHCISLGGVDSVAAGTPIVGH